jgi:hypothetical protein
MLAHVHQALISSGYGAQAFSDVLITITLYSSVSASRTGLKQIKNAVVRLCSYLLTRGIVVVWVGELCEISLPHADRQMTC